MAMTMTIKSNEEGFESGLFVFDGGVVADLDCVQRRPWIWKRHFSLANECLSGLLPLSPLNSCSPLSTAASSEDNTAGVGAVK